MKIKTLVFTFTSCIFFASCATTKQLHKAIERSPFINQQEFTGLESLGTDLSTLRLDYALDSPAGKELQLNSCTQVNSLNNVKTSQYHLLRLMKANCMAAGHYFEALKSANVPSFLPASLNASFIKSLPAQAIPNLGGQSLRKRHGTLAQVQKNMKVLSVDNTGVKLSLDNNLVVKYLIIARGDFNHDGIEDMLLRSDWHVNSAFGKGFDLLMVTKISKDAKPSLILRW